MNTNISASNENQNKGLLFFLWFKIIMTLLVWSTPLLLPDPFLNQMTRLFFGFDFEPKIFSHILGVSFLALIVSYYAGVTQLKAEKDIEHIVWVGIVSNGLITFLLILYGFIGSYNEWLFIGQIYMWGSALLTGFITVGLFVTGILKNQLSMNKEQ